MENKDLRAKIYQQLDRLDNEGLQMVNDVVSEYLKQSDVKDGWDSLSADDKAAIEEGLDQLDRGLGIPFEEVQERINKKLSQYGI